MDGPEKETVFETAALAGEILLASGAEIFRVDETMCRIARAYQCGGLEPFVLSNGIFLTSGGAGGEHYRAKVRHIPLGGSRLDRIDAVNQLSREIEQGLHTPAQALEELRRIRTSPQKPAWLQVLASGLGSGAFCFLFGGSLADAAAAFLAGLALYSYFLFVVRGRLSKIALNISGGALVTLLSILLVKLGLGARLDMVTVGSIIPLLPGVAFTNAIRDIADEDYISGTVRLLDVILVVVCAAFGVGLVMAGYNACMGV
ncbi:threonine/serine exporter family protein [Allofournierella sp.]|uniref:threonine/serine exporter family protein n=1 Tax=Allofournierella sp. TaxID=1940256 RepID=UPI003AF1B931